MVVLVSEIFVFENKPHLSGIGIILICVKFALTSQGYWNDTKSHETQITVLETSKLGNNQTYVQWMNHKKLLLAMMHSGLGTSQCADGS